MSTPPTFDPASPEVQGWRLKRRMRPSAIETAGPGQESVWDYPRPPRVEPVAALVEIDLDGAPVARSIRALRVLETSSPPVLYLPDADLIDAELIDRDDGALCEWKGWARYVDLRHGSRTVARAGWRFDDPFDDLGQDYGRLRGHVAVYPALFACRLGGEPVTAQAGGYYGGWITSAIKGPFKGAPGTGDW